MWNKPEDVVQSELEKSIGDLLMRHHGIFAGDASEPKRVKTLVSDTFVTGFQEAVNNELDKAGWSAFALAGWVDHYPRINFNQKSAEVGDLLLVLSILGSQTVKRAILFQAKLFNKEARMPTKETAQLELYKRWPKFEMTGRPRSLKSAEDEKAEVDEKEGKPMGTYEILDAALVDKNDQSDVMKHGKYMLVKKQAHCELPHGDVWKCFEPIEKSSSKGSLASAIAQFVCFRPNMGRQFSYKLPDGWDSKRRQIASSTNSSEPVKTYGWNELVSILISYAATRTIENTDPSKIKQSIPGVASSQAASDNIRSFVDQSLVDKVLTQYLGLLDGYYAVAESPIRPVTRMVNILESEYDALEQLSTSEAIPPSFLDKETTEDSPSDGMAVLHLSIVPIRPDRRD